MTDIRNEAELRGILEKEIEGAIKNVSEKVLKELLATIRRDVFTEPNLWYERTGQFEKSWVWGQITKSVNSITRELYYDPSGVEYIAKKWQHGNPGQSAVDNLADILNLAFNNYRDGYTSGLKFGGKHFSHKRKPYWENLIKFLFDKGKLESFFVEEFKSRGMKVTKI